MNELLGAPCWRLSWQSSKRTGSCFEHQPMVGTNAHIMIDGQPVSTQPSIQEISVAGGSRSSTGNTGLSKRVSFRHIKGARYGSRFDSSTNPSFVYQRMFLSLASATVRLSLSNQPTRRYTEVAPSSAARNNTVRRAAVPSPLLSRGSSIWIQVKTQIGKTSASLNCSRCEGQPAWLANSLWVET